MSDHVRKQIRHALAAALRSIPGMSDRVHVNRAARLGPEQLPALIVTTPSETVEDYVVNSPRRVERRIEILVTACVKGATLDDAADDLGLLVEAAVEAADDLGGLIADRATLAEVSLFADETVSPPTAELAMRYQATAYTLAADPGVVV